MDSHRVQEKAVKEIQAPLDKARRAVDNAWEALLEAEAVARKKTIAVTEAQKEFDEVRRGSGYSPYHVGAVAWWRLAVSRCCRVGLWSHVCGPQVFCTVCRDWAMRLCGRCPVEPSGTVSSRARV